MPHPMHSDYNTAMAILLNPQFTDFKEKMTPDEKDALKQVSGAYAASLSVPHQTYETALKVFQRFNKETFS